MSDKNIKEEMHEESSSHESEASQSEEPLTGSEHSDVSETEEMDKEQQTSSKEGILSNAIKKLLEKPVSGNKPILSKNSIEKRIDEKKLEFAAKRALSLSKKEEMVQDRKRTLEVDEKTREFDKKLRKVATRGVVHLFNAIRSAQRSIGVDEESKGSTGAVMRRDNPQTVEITKNAFMEMLTKQKSVETQQTQKEEPKVSWIRSDYAEKARHWDDEDDEDDE